MTHIKDQVALVTGAASGIGRALAIALTDRGAKCVVISDINEQGLEVTKQLIANKAVNVLVRPVDVADRAAVEALIDDVVHTCGGLDIVINNAGVALSAPIDTMSYSSFDWIMGINFWGAVFATKAILPHMLKQNHGHIVNVTSMISFFGVPTQSAYCASKFALMGFTESLIHEVSGKNINVTTVHPGSIRTNIFRNGRMEGGAEIDNDIDAFDVKFQKSALTTPDEAAKIILRGVEKNKKHVLVGIDAVIMCAFTRWFPSLYFSLMGFAGRRAGKKRAGVA